MLHGLFTKALGRLLGIAPRTVEMHRADLMAALGARSLAQVLHLTVGLALQPLERGEIRLSESIVCCTVNDERPYAPRPA